MVAKRVPLIMFFFSTPGTGWAAETAVGEAPKPLIYFTRSKTPLKNDKRNEMSLPAYANSLPGGPPPPDPDVDELNRAYNSGKHNALEYKDYFPATTTNQFEQTAKECGEQKQRENSPSNFGGKTMCGRAVAEMIKCMSQVTGSQDGCNGACGDGKDFVNCSKGGLQKCGYEKIPATDGRCNQAGAVLSYAQSPTARGREFGHVEFVCGNNRFCSVYSQPHDRPWPRHPADACWFPAKFAMPQGKKDK